MKFRSPSTWDMPRPILTVLLILLSCIKYRLTIIWPSSSCISAYSARFNRTLPIVIFSPRAPPL